MVVGGLGEETGWRGYLLPALEQRFSPPATILVAVAWGSGTCRCSLWSAATAASPPTYLLWWLGLLFGAIVLTWLYNHTGSIALAAVWHGTYNLVPATAAAQGVLQAVTTTVVLIAAVALVVFEVRARRRRTGSVLSGSVVSPRT